ncbi:MAG: hypothetical protein J6S26_02995 [Solobacterium sp.]|nr:hypothetical protein [Solobacterium sp.]
MINPWKRTDTLEEAAKGAGVIFDPIDPNFLPYGMKEDGFFFMQGMAEARYRRDEDRLTLRRTNISVKNISGDYHSYPKSYYLDAGGMSVLCRGTEDKVNDAEFEPFGCRCSISYNPGQPGNGLTHAQVIAIAQAMK